jgi:diaminopropionate ammonia-lyase
LRSYLNPAVRRDDAAFRGLFSDAEYRDVHAYFAAHPELPPTPLRSLRQLAMTLGVRAVDAKDETHRFGLNAFKILGVRYAVHRLGDAAVGRGLVCATAGNHGRAVARVAKQKGAPCTIFVPAATRPLSAAERRTRTDRVDGMRADGAVVVEVDGSYEDAVRDAAAHAATSGATVVSDMSWEGYEEIPRWIMAGYTQLFEEASGQWDLPPTVVIIQGGVGGLVAAAASWFAWRFGEKRPYLVACEPENAACLMASAQNGAETTVTGELDTIMAGLRCAEPSPAAWPAIAAGIDAFVRVSDDDVLRTMETLASADDPAERIDAGPSGACGAAALVALATAPEFVHVRHAAGLDRSSRVLVIITEGA